MGSIFVVSKVIFSLEVCINLVIRVSYSLQKLERSRKEPVSENSSYKTKTLKARIQANTREGHLKTRSRCPVVSSTSLARQVT